MDKLRERLENNIYNYIKKEKTKFETNSNTFITDIKIDLWSHRVGDTIDKTLIGGVKISTACKSKMFKNKIIEVCANCYCASCWYGEFYCGGYKNSDTIKLSVWALRKINTGESEEYWSDKYMENIYGEKAPFGYKNE